jgi:hypothetical protein
MHGNQFPLRPESVEITVWKIGATRLKSIAEVIPEMQGEAFQRGLALLRFESAAGAPSRQGMSVGVGPTTERAESCVPISHDLAMAGGGGGRFDLYS